jgi:hypothetical protein
MPLSARLVSFSQLVHIDAINIAYVPQRSIDAVLSFESRTTKSKSGYPASKFRMLAKIVQIFRADLGGRKSSVSY